MNLSLVLNLKQRCFFDRQDLRLRLVPTNDDSLVRTIRNLLLNVDDCAPSIPLVRPKPVIEVAYTASGRHTAVGNEEAVVIDEVHVGESTENFISAATAKQWEGDSNCESSITSSRMATKLMTSVSQKDEEDGKPIAKILLERDTSAIESSHDPLTDFVRQGDPLQTFVLKGNRRSVASSTSSSSSDDDSLSSSSTSDSNSDTSSSSSSSSSNTMSA